MTNLELLEQMRSKYRYTIQMSSRVDVAHAPAWAIESPGNLKSNILSGSVIFNRFKTEDRKSDDEPKQEMVFEYYHNNSTVYARNIALLPPWERAVFELAYRLTAIIEASDYPDFDQWHYLYFSDVDPESSDKERILYNVLKEQHQSYLNKYRMLQNFTGSDCDLFRNYYHCEPLNYGEHRLTLPRDLFSTERLHRGLRLARILAVFISRVEDDSGKIVHEDPVTKGIIEDWKKLPAAPAKPVAHKEEKPTKEDIDNVLNKYIAIGPNPEPYQICMTKYLLSHYNDVQKHLLYMGWPKDKLDTYASEFIRDGALFPIWEKIKGALKDTEIFDIIHNVLKMVPEGNTEAETRREQLEILFMNIPDLTEEEMSLAIYMSNPEIHTMVYGFQKVLDSVLSETFRAI